jgi:Serine/threonine protein kinase
VVCFAASIVEDMPQTLLNNRYLLEHKIGEGGMARVYRGRDTRLNRWVAIKVLHDHYVDEPGFLERFHHEAQAAANLSHPNVVDVYDVGQDGDLHYIVMEYVDGRDLKMLINRDAPLAIDRAVAIAEAVALGLEAAHRIGLIHRDIKPQNILVSPDGQVHITDFGIAKSHLSTATTATGVTFGTADYIAPEQARGEAATPRSDIYSLGIVLYEMLTGKLPFVGENAIGVAMQHINAAPLPPSRINPLIPPQLENLVLRALAKNPADRPNSAQEFARLLRNYRTLTTQETSFTNTPLVATGEQNYYTRPNSPRFPASNSRATIPPPNARHMRAPDTQGIGCGGFIVGFLLLSVVLGIVYLFTSNSLDLLFPPNTLGRQTTVSVPTVGSSATTTSLTPTVMPSATPSPTPLPLVSVPDLVGKTQEEARRLLEAARLIPYVGGQVNDESIPLGSVVSQEIPAGQELQEGQTVTYTLSLGPSIVLIEVPDFSQAPLNFARNQLEILGLQVVVVEQSSPSIDPGYIISQTPRPPARVPPGTEVTLVVSRGDMVQVPPLKGLTEDQAKAKLAATDGALNYSFSDMQGPDKLGDMYYEYAPGTVVSSDPPEGTWVPRGTYVTLGVRAP